MRIAIIGAGAVGTAVAVLLKEKGYHVAGVASRTLASAQRLAERVGGAPCFATAEEAARQAEVIFITTNDTAIAEVTAQIARKDGFRPGQAVIHLSGSLSSDVLQPAAEKGAITLSIHPLQSVPSPEAGIQGLPRAVYSIEGDRRGYELAEKIIAGLGSHSFFHIDSEAKPLYHAAACVASNYLVTLLDLSQQLLTASGMPANLLFPALLPLIQGTLHNIGDMGIPAALTGPIARGDVATVQEHLEVMQEQAPELVELYVGLARRTVDLAQAKGTLKSDAASRLLQVLANASPVTASLPTRPAGLARNLMA